MGKQEATGRAPAKAIVASGAGSQVQAAPPSEPPRRDSVQCPRCKRWGCPAVGGSRMTSDGTRRYRRCSGERCGHTFVTIQPHGGEERVEA